MQINYLAILVSAILSMVVGSIWYGPLFGKKWAELIGADPNDKKKMKEMQKSAGPLYMVQFLLTCSKCSFCHTSSLTVNELAG